MNKKGRKTLQEAIDKINEAMELISGIAEEESEKFDNAPENLQESERYQKIYDNYTELEDITQECEQLSERVSDVINS